MVCVNCGTLNAGDGELCTRCRRPLALAPDEPGALCVVHTARPAVSTCSVCGGGVCQECRASVDEVIYCPICVKLLEAPPDQNPLVLTSAEMGTLLPASFAVRLAAGAIDSALVGSAAVVLALVFWMLTGAPPGSPWQPGTNLLYWILLFAGTSGYFVGMVAAEGRTVGYAQTNLVVVRPNGTQVDLRTSALRYLAGILSLLCLMAGFLWILVDRERRAWHDRIADTVVMPWEGRGV